MVKQAFSPADGLAMEREWWRELVCSYDKTSAPLDARHARCLLELCLLRVMVSGDRQVLPAVTSELRGEMGANTGGL